MKRVLNWILCICLLSANIALPAFAEETDLSEEIRICEAVGVWDSAWENGEFVTRAMLAKAAVMLYNPDFVPAAEDEYYYRDVGADSEYAGYINEARRRGYMFGLSEKIFAPEESLTTEQAVVVMMRAMGYSQLAAAKGGYSAGYMSINEARDFLRGLSGRTYDKLTAGVLAKVIVNSFDAHIPEVTTGVQIETGEERTSLSLRGMYTDKGVVSANELTSLVGSSGIGEGKVKIGSDEFYAGTTSAGEYLGRRVDYIYRDDGGENTLVCIYNAEKNNKELIIDARDIVKLDFAARKYTYEMDGGKQKNASFKLDADIIYNGKAASPESEELCPKSGSVTLVDNDRDGGYEVVIIDSFRQIFVDDINSTEGKIYDASYAANDIDLRFNEDGVKYTITDKNGKSRKFFEISKKNVISAAVSKDESYIRLILSTDKAEGVIKSIDAAEGTINIGDVEYELAARIADAPSYRVGDTVTAYLDYRGDVAEIEYPSSNLNFAYITELVRDELEDVPGRVRMFCDNGQFITAPIAAKIKINDEMHKNASYEELYDALQINGKIDQIAEYSLDDEGQVVRINTQKKKLYKVQNLNTNPQGGLSSGIAGAMSYYRTERTFSYRVFLKNSTKLFMIPYSDLRNKEAFRCVSADSLQSGYENVIDAYNTDEDMRYADVVVMDARVGDVRYSADSSFGVVKSIAKAVDSSGDVVLQMKVLTQNGEETVILENADSSNPDFVIDGRVWGRTQAVTGAASVKVEINQGDTIRFTADSTTKKIYGAQMIFDCATRKFYNPTTNSAFASTLRVTGGRVADFSDNIVTVEKCDIYNQKYGGAAPREYYPFGKCTTAAVDMADERPYVTAAAAADMVWREDRNNSWYIFWTKDRVPKFAVVYNGLGENPNVYLETEEGFAGYTDAKPYVGFVYPY